MPINGKRVLAQQCSARPNNGKNGFAQRTQRHAETALISLGRRCDLLRSLREALFVVIVVFAVVPARAATFTAASCNRADVNAVINGPTHTAVNGDVIQIPAG